MKNLKEKYKIIFYGHDTKKGKLIWFFGQQITKQAQWLVIIYAAQHF